MEMFNVIMKASNWKSQGIEIRTNCNAAVSHFKTKPWSKPFQLNVCETICHNIRSSSLLSYRFISLNYCPKCLIWDFWFRKLIVLLVVLLLRFNDDSVFFSFSFLLVSDVSIVGLDEERNDWTQTPGRFFGIRVSRKILPDQAKMRVLIALANCFGLCWMSFDKQFISGSWYFNHSSTTIFFIIIFKSYSRMKIWKDAFEKCVT